MLRTRRSPLLAALGAIALLGFVATAPAAARDVTFEEACFPSCDTTDGRFLIIAAGAALSTLSDEVLRLKFAIDDANLDPLDPKFTFEIFDGDSTRTDSAGNFHWDVGAQIPVLFTLLAIETQADGTEIFTPVPASKITLEAGAPANPFSSQITFDNDWFSVSVDIGPEALVANTGDYRYQLEIERDASFPFNPATQALLNAFKVRTDEAVFLSLLEQPFAFEAKWTNIADVLTVYPNFDFSDGVGPADVIGTTYDGSFTFYLNVPAPQPLTPRSRLTIFDGDLDHGNFDFTDPDTNDLDTCYAAETPACSPIVPLPFAPGPSVTPEGAKVPAPFDDVDPAGGAFGLNLMVARPPAVRYRLSFPENTDPGTVTCRAGSGVEGAPVEGRRTIVNLNPSSNQEWEGFTLTTQAADFPAQADCLVDLIPSGIYRIDLVGMDMNNLNAWFFGEDVCALQPDRDPVCPAGLFLIGDTVWLDSDGDGNGDPAEIAADSEAGIPGVVLNLIDINGTRMGRTLTDTDGLYQFAVDKGRYTVEVDSLNFLANPPAGAIGDRVWLDSDGDGIQDGGEPGIPAVEVQLVDAGLDGFPGGGDDQVLDSTLTDGNGHYLFTGLGPGTYYANVVNASVPAGLTITGGTDPSATRTVVSDDIFLDLDFGYSNGSPGTALVGDFVWHDLDSDGIQDPGEPGISGVTLSLIPAGSTVSVQSTVTRGGFYLFAGVAPGTYSVAVTDINGVLGGYFSTTGGGTTGPFGVVAGDALLDKDFGYFNNSLFAIDNVVWLDLDRDGVRDAGEPGIAGVTIALIGGTGAPLATAVTAADGSFSFSGLPSGAYSLLITDVGGVLNGLLPTTRASLVGSQGVTIAGADKSGVDFGFVFGGALFDTTPTTASPTQTNDVLDGNVLVYDFGYRPNNPPGTGTPGYWKNHPEAWPVDEITLGDETFTKAEAIDIIAREVSGNKIYTLAAALISTKLNALIGNDTSCISDVIQAADDWFRDHPVSGHPVRGNSRAWKDGEPLYLQLDDYNNGKLCAASRG